jgi:hypothetical protein
LQNWHLYFFSGAMDDLRMVDDAAAIGGTVMLATGILAVLWRWASVLVLSQSDG